MLTQMLIAAGKEAKFARQEDGETSTAYKLAIDKIDEINIYIRASNPEKFWQEDDPEYQKLQRQWAVHRAPLLAQMAAERAIKAAKRAD